MNIKEGRKTNFFWAHNAIFDKWGANLKGNGIAVYLCLVRHANNDGTCYPSLNTIAKKCGICRNTVIRIIDKLVDLGLIVREKRDGQKGRTSNLYTIVDISEVIGLGAGIMQNFHYLSTRSGPEVNKYEETYARDTTTEPRKRLKGKPSNGKNKRSSCKLDKKTTDLPVTVKKLPEEISNEIQSNSNYELDKNTTNLPVIIKTLSEEISNEIQSNSNYELDENITGLPITAKKLPRDVDNTKSKGNCKLDKDSADLPIDVKSLSTNGTLNFDFALQNFSQEQMQNALKTLKSVPTMDKQLILDELNSAVSKNTVKSPICYLNTLVKRYHAGDFIPTSELCTQRNKPTQKITSNANTCKYCKGIGQIRFIRQDGTLTELIDCKHGQLAHEYIQNVKEEYGYNLQPHKARMPHQLHLSI